ncbi:hypothetical protein G7Y89_g6360 [Cudoniella acicularis]|uniref:Stc1 domain-containing protein n=1 Tax=Cudoniella acicularis TaxID=354080 RepID=A0A8H4RMV2_9HELO|nr:hypothetical protein G7Y89_g6360 [Cudoniella acicularis]
MASNYSNITSAARKNIVPLDRYKCKQCHQWKPYALFSNNELNKYRHMKISGGNPSGESAGLRCLNCSDDQRRELKCLGACGRILPLSSFSKASRRNKHYWCEDCVNWKEAVEPGVAVAPAPNNEAAPEELQQSFVNASEPSEVSFAGDVNDGQTRSVTSAWYNTAAKPNSATTDLSGQLQGMSLNGSRAGPAKPNPVLPHLRGVVDPATVARSVGQQNRPDEDLRSVSSISNPYEDRSLGTAAQSDADGWTAAGAQSRGMSFNAWDSNGVRHVQQHQSSTTSQTFTRGATAQTPSSMTASRNENTSSGAANDDGRAFAKPIGRRYPNRQVTKPIPAAPAPPASSRARYGCEGDSSDDDYD